MSSAHVNHGGHHPLPGLKPLLPSPSVTIYFDGLIHTAYNEQKRLYQGAVLTQAEGHHLVIEVRLRGNDELLFPTPELPWVPAHEVIKGIAPLWLFVDSGQGIQEEEFSARLHTPEADDEQSFNRVLNFEQLYRRAIPPKRETFAEFNFPHGISYSAANTDAKLKSLPRNAPIGAATDKKDIEVSTLGAVDIDDVSNGASTKYIVLAGAGGNEFFRFELEPEKHYEIKILNQPTGAHGGTHHHESHFLQFYELFDLKEGEERFFVEPSTTETEPDTTETVHSPPCVSTSGDLKGGLPGGG